MEFFVTRLLNTFKSNKDFMTYTDDGNLYIGSNNVIVKIEDASSFCLLETKFDAEKYFTDVKKEVLVYEDWCRYSGFDTESYAVTLPLLNRDFFNAMSSISHFRKKYFVLLEKGEIFGVDFHNEDGEIRGTILTGGLQIHRPKDIIEHI